MKTYLHMLIIKNLTTPSWEARWLKWSFLERQKRKWCSDSYKSLIISAQICLPDTPDLTSQNPTSSSLLEILCLCLPCLACFLMPLVWTQSVNEFEIAFLPSAWLSSHSTSQKIKTHNPESAINPPNRRVGNLTDYILAFIDRFLLPRDMKDLSSY